MMKINVVLTLDDAKELASSALHVTGIAGKTFKVVDAKWEKYGDSVTFTLESVESPFEKPTDWYDINEDVIT